MLVVSRKESDSINIHGPSKVVIVKVKGGTVRIGIEAAPSVLILRGELEQHQRSSLAAEPVAETEVGEDIKRAIKQ